jgi:hypothetical protein
MTKVHVGFLFLFAVGTASADIDMVSQSGTWVTQCPSVLCSAFGDTWSYSFLTSSVVTSPLTEINDPISDFEYSINGVIVSSLTVANGAVHWLFWTQDGGFQDSPLGIEFGEWVQLFTTPAPGVQYATLNPGSYDLPLNGYTFESIDGISNSFPGRPAAMIAGPLVITDLSAVPEPASICLQLTMLVGIAVIARKRLLETGNG